MLASEEGRENILIIHDCLPWTLGCGELTEMLGTTIVYTNWTKLGSVAMHSCDEANGYRLPPGTGVDQTCTNTGWSSRVIMCQSQFCLLVNSSSLCITYTYLPLPTPHIQSTIVVLCLADLARPDSGSIDFTTSILWLLFSCQSNFMLSGVTERVSGFNGWSGE